MKTAPKVVLAIGAVLTLIGIIGFAVGIDSVSEIEDEFAKYELENVTNGTIVIEDTDDYGDLGVTFWVKGVYEDANENGEWDICESTTINVLSTPEVNTDWDEGLNGDFYYEGNYEAYGNVSNCDSNSLNKVLDREGDGLVKVGRACLACYSGNLTFESNVPVWVTYDDKLAEEIIDEIGAIFFGFIGGFGGFCCGIIFLIIGLIMALTMKDDKMQQMMFTPPADNQLIAPQAVNKSVTHMSQPDFGKPPQGGL
tara:strand:- start:1000 stop:1761 length:762 start_codon:yes stop_codon:yes gene_type:complete